MSREFLAAIAQAAVGVPSPITPRTYSRFEAPPEMRFGETDLTSDETTWSHLFTTPTDPDEFTGVARLLRSFGLDTLPLGALPAPAAAPDQSDPFADPSAPPEAERAIAQRDPARRDPAQPRAPRGSRPAALAAAPPPANEGEERLTEASDSATHQHVDGDAVEADAADAEGRAAESDDAVQRRDETFVGNEEPGASSGNVSPHARDAEGIARRSVRAETGALNEPGVTRGSVADDSADLESGVAATAERTSVGSDADKAAVRARDIAPTADERRLVVESADSRITPIAHQGENLPAGHPVNDSHHTESTGRLIPESEASYEDHRPRVDHDVIAENRDAPTSAAAVNDDRGSSLNREQSAYHPVDETGADAPVAPTRAMSDLGGTEGRAASLGNPFVAEANASRRDDFGAQERRTRGSAVEGAWSHEPSQPEFDDVGYETTRLAKSGDDANSPRSTSSPTTRDTEQAPEGRGRVHRVLPQPSGDAMSAATDHAEATDAKTGPVSPSRPQSTDANETPFATESSTRQRVAPEDVTSEARQTPTGGSFGIDQGEPPTQGEIAPTPRITTAGTQGEEPRTESPPTRSSAEAFEATITGDASHEVSPPAELRWSEGSSERPNVQPPTSQQSARDESASSPPQRYESRIGEEQRLLASSSDPTKSTEIAAQPRGIRYPEAADASGTIPIRIGNDEPLTSSVSAAHGTSETATNIPEPAERSEYATLANDVDAARATPDRTPTSTNQTQAERADVADQRATVAPRAASEGRELGSAAASSGSRGGRELEGADAASRDQIIGGELPEGGRGALRDDAATRSQLPDDGIGASRRDTAASPQLSEDRTVTARDEARAPEGSSDRESADAHSYPINHEERADAARQEAQHTIPETRSEIAQRGELAVQSDRPDLVSSSREYNRQDQIRPDLLAEAEQRTDVAPFDATDEPALHDRPGYRDLALGLNAGERFRSDVPGHDAARVREPQGRLIRDDEPIAAPSHDLAAAVGDRYRAPLTDARENNDSVVLAAESLDSKPVVHAQSRENIHFQESDETNAAGDAAYQRLQRQAFTPTEAVTAEPTASITPIVSPRDGIDDAASDTTGREVLLRQDVPAAPPGRAHDDAQKSALAHTDVRATHQVEGVAPTTASRPISSDPIASRATDSLATSHLVVEGGDRGVPLSSPSERRSGTSRAQSSVAGASGSEPNAIQAAAPRDRGDFVEPTLIAGSTQQREQREETPREPVVRSSPGVPERFDASMQPDGSAITPRFGPTSSPEASLVTDAGEVQHASEIGGLQGAYVHPSVASDARGESVAPSGTASGNQPQGDALNGPEIAAATLTSFDGEQRSNVGIERGTHRPSSAPRASRDERAIQATRASIDDGAFAVERATSDERTIEAGREAAGGRSISPRVFERREGSTPERQVEAPHSSIPSRAIEQERASKPANEGNAGRSPTQSNTFEPEQAFGSKNTADGERASTPTRGSSGESSFVGNEQKPGQAIASSNVRESEQTFVPEYAADAATSAPAAFADQKLSERLFAEGPSSARDERESRRALVEQHPFDTGDADEAGRSYLTEHSLNEERTTGLHRESELEDTSELGNASEIEGGVVRQRAVEASRSERSHVAADRTPDRALPAGEPVAPRDSIGVVDSDSASSEARHRGASELRVGDVAHVADRQPERVTQTDVAGKFSGVHRASEADSASAGSIRGYGEPVTATEPGGAVASSAPGKPQALGTASQLPRPAQSSDAEPRSSGSDEQSVSLVRPALEARHTLSEPGAVVQPVSVTPPEQERTPATYNRSSDEATPSSVVWHESTAPSVAARDRGESTHEAVVRPVASVESLSDASGTVEALRQAQGDRNPRHPEPVEGAASRTFLTGSTGLERDAGVSRRRGDEDGAGRRGTQESDGERDTTAARQSGAGAPTDVRAASSLIGDSRRISQRRTADVEGSDQAGIAGIDRAEVAGIDRADVAGLDRVDVAGIDRAGVRIASIDDVGAGIVPSVGRNASIAPTDRTSSRVVQDGHAGSITPADLPEAQATSTDQGSAQISPFESVRTNVTPVAGHDAPEPHVAVQRATDSGAADARAVGRQLVDDGRLASTVERVDLPLVEPPTVAGAPSRAVDGAVLPPTIVPAARVRGRFDGVGDARSGVDATDGSRLGPPSIDGRARPYSSTEPPNAAVPLGLAVSADAAASAPVDAGTGLNGLAVAAGAESGALGAGAIDASSRAFGGDSSLAAAEAISPVASRDVFRSQLPATAVGSELPGSIVPATSVAFPDSVVPAATSTYVGEPAPLRSASVEPTTAAQRAPVPAQLTPTQIEPVRLTPIPSPAPIMPLTPASPEPLVAAAIADASQAVAASNEPAVAKTAVPAEAVTSLRALAVEAIESRDGRIPAPASVPAASVPAGGGAAAGPPTIRVAIDRIEIAAPAAPPSAPVRRRPVPRMTLDRYGERRS
ncbi:MAG: hypothetical protein JOZ86_16850 [Candidatus Eremiobacteraeota bacterium]|nr:hypothetical protein [Candidatus Eremiobacteraeota bacterium]